MKLLNYLLAILLLVSACGKNEITTIDGDPSGKENTPGNTDSDSEDRDDDLDDDSSETDGSGITVVDGTIYIEYSESGAKVSGDTLGIVTVSGNRVTVANTGESCITYVLSGKASDGFFKLYSSVKQTISLNGLNLTNPNGAAINNQSHKYTSVIVSGENYLADGSVNSSGDYNSETSDEDMKAAFFSEGQLIFSGDGALTVTATGKSGITSDDYIRITETPTINVSSKLGHGIRGKDKVVIKGGNTVISVSGTGKKGISTDGNFNMSDGYISITSSSAAGLVDGELTGAAGIKADSTVNINGGNLEITVKGTGAKGINCDGDGHFNSGSVKVTATGSNYGSSSSGGRPGWGGNDSSSDNTSAAKGLKFDGNLYFDGADVTASASSHEAIEAKGTIEISAGNINATSSDDAINSGSDMTVTGGNIYAFSSGNDGLDANGNMYIKGGYVYAVGSGSPEVALDANTEQNYKLYISGGSLVAFGGIESGSSITQPVISISSWTSNTSYSLYNGSTLLLEFTSPSKGGNGIILSHPDLKSGSSYTFKSGSTSTTVTASMTAQGGTGGGGNDGHGGPGGPGGGRR